MKILDKILKRNRYPVAKYPIKEAFVSGGITYYQFEDFNNTPPMRGLKTLVFYEEMKMKCTLEFLRLHTEAVEELLLPKQGKVVNVYGIKQLNDQLKQRLDIALDTELLYKIASIVYFDKNENVEDYDYSYNATKVENWKKHGGADFFLQQPLQELVPVLKDFDESFLSYFQVVEKLNQKHLDNLLRYLPRDRMQTLKGRSYLSLAVTPPKLKD